jgi:hypothetical protein
MIMKKRRTRNRQTRVGGVRRKADSSVFSEEVAEKRRLRMNGRDVIRMVRKEKAGDEREGCHQDGEREGEFMIVVNCIT